MIFTVLSDSDRARNRHFDLITASNAMRFSYEYDIAVPKFTKFKNIHPKLVRYYLLREQIEEKHYVIKYADADIMIMHPPSGAVLDHGYKSWIIRCNQIVHNYFNQRIDPAMYDYYINSGFLAFGPDDLEFLNGFIKFLEKNQYLMQYTESCGCGIDQAILNAYAWWEKWPIKLDGCFRCPNTHIQQPVTRGITLNNVLQVFPKTIGTIHFNGPHNNQTKDIIKKIHNHLIPSSPL